MSDIDYLLDGDLDEIITWRGHLTMFGGIVRGSRRSIAHLEATDQAARKRFGTGVVVIQSAYNVGVAASAGTHDKDAVYDIHIPGVDWWTQQRFFREQGWAAWYRFPPTFGHHIHMISLGYRNAVGIFVPGQVDDYYRHALGLKGQHDSGIDDTWHPADIDSTIFNYPAWKAALEDDMFEPADREKLEDTLTAVRELAKAERERAVAAREQRRRIAENLRKTARSHAKALPAAVVAELQAAAAELDGD